MKCGGLSVDALLRCRCASQTTPCAMLREDGSAKHAANATGDLITKFRDTMLYGHEGCASDEAFGVREEDLRGRACGGLRR